MSGPGREVSEISCLSLISREDLHALFCLIVREVKSHSVSVCIWLEMMKWLCKVAKGRCTQLAIMSAALLSLRWEVAVRLVKKK